VEAGETFFFRSREDHLWMIISDPSIDAEQVVIVNLTTYRKGSVLKEIACLLHPDDHPYIRHESCVNYHDARVYPDKHLTSLLARDKITLNVPLAPEILKRVRDGASLSTKIDAKHLTILLDQGVLD
jgi:hypothetical protein